MIKTQVSFSSATPGNFETRWGRKWTPLAGEEVTVLESWTLSSQHHGGTEVPTLCLGRFESSNLGRVRPSATTSFHVGLARRHQTPTASDRQAETGRPDSWGETKCLDVSSLNTPGHWKDRA